MYNVQFLIVYDKISFQIQQIPKFYYNTMQDKFNFVWLRKKS